MVKKESLPKTKDIPLLLRASVTGVVATFAATICLAMLIKNGILGAGEHGVFSRIALVISAASSSAYLCLRSKQNRLPLSAAANLITLVFVVSISMLCVKCELDYRAVLVDLTILFVVSFAVCAVTSKCTKRKRSKKSRK